MKSFIYVYLSYYIYQNFNLKSYIVDEFQPTSKTDVRFSDIIGIDEFKEELEDIVNNMKNRNLFTRKNNLIPKGVLLIGPPGCGKTQLARAVAGETNLPFY